MHDVAAVLLFTVGELEAYPILEHLARQQLRDATRPGLEPVVELLHLLFPIVRKVHSWYLHGNCRHLNYDAMQCAIFVSEMCAATAALKPSISAGVYILLMQEIPVL